MVDVISRAHRILNKLSNYRDLSEHGKLPIGLPPVPTVSPSEQMIGMYVTDPTSYLDTIIFTDSGLYLFRDDAWMRILYSDIDHVVFPQYKTEVTGLTIVCRSGSAFWLPVKGSKAGKFYDAFEILRFLDRVNSDVTA